MSRPENAAALELSWHEVGDRVERVAELVRRDGIPEVIVGVLRGGMMPAVLLAHRLGVREVRGIAVIRTLAEGPNQPKTVPLVTNPASVGILAAADVLLVDDVAGSGDTIEAAVERLRTARRVRRAVLVVNTSNWGAANPVAPQQVLDYIGLLCTGWVRFPWEVR